MKARKGRNWLYVHHVIDADLYYVGQTTNLQRRFNNADYSDSSLSTYINTDIPFKQNRNIETVVLPVSDREFALRLEDMLILKYKAQGKCINKCRSGLIKAKDPIKYNTESSMQWKKEHHKEALEIYRRHNKKPENRIYTRVTSFNRLHPDRVIETPLEAKQKYLEWGYIPDYIKSDDLTAPKP